ncbi:MAG: hypothetical protein JWO98_676 [Frankiales bacterium]|nr:hypothetical protein [Frankiales bacterium]
MPRPGTCQELRCGELATEPFDAGTPDDPLVYWLCTQHREQVRTDRWNAQTNGVLLVGQDAVLETPKQVKRLNARASDWTQTDADGKPSGFVELNLTLGYPADNQYDEDITFLIPADVALPLGTVIPDLAKDAQRHVDPGNGPVVVRGDG